METAQRIVQFKLAAHPGGLEPELMVVTQGESQPRDNPMFTRRKFSPQLRVKTAIETSFRHAINELPYDPV